MIHSINNAGSPHICPPGKTYPRKFLEKINIDKSIKKSFLIDPLTTNNAICAFTLSQILLVPISEKFNTVVKTLTFSLYSTNKR